MAGPGLRSVAPAARGHHSPRLEAYHRLDPTRQDLAGIAAFSGLSPFAQRAVRWSGGAGRGSRRTRSCSDGPVVPIADRGGRPGSRRCWPVRRSSRRRPSPPKSVSWSPYNKTDLSTLDLPDGTPARLVTVRAASRTERVTTAADRRAKALEPPLRHRHTSGSRRHRRAGASGADRRRLVPGPDVRARAAQRRRPVGARGGDRLADRGARRRRADRNTDRPYSEPAGLARRRWLCVARAGQRPRSYDLSPLRPAGLAHPGLGAGQLLAAAGELPVHQAGVFTAARDHLAR